MLRRAEQSAVLAGGAVLAEAQRALCGALNNLGGMCMQVLSPDPPFALTLAQP